MPRVQLIKLRRDTAANWASANPVLALGEPGLAWDTKAHKVGDGTTTWNSLGEVGSATFGPSVGSDNWLKAWGSNVDALIRATTITRDASEAATGASVIWPDGTAGAYVGTASSGTPGAVDSYTVTYLGSTTKTVTQPTMTRNAAGSGTTRPALTVA